MWNIVAVLNIWGGKAKVWKLVIVKPGGRTSLVWYAQPFRTHQWMESRTVQCDNGLHTTSITSKERGLCTSNHHFKQYHGSEPNVRNNGPTDWTTAGGKHRTRHAGLQSHLDYWREQVHIQDHGTGSWFSECNVLILFCYIVRTRNNLIVSFKIMTEISAVHHWPDFTVNILHFSKKCDELWSCNNIYEIVGLRYELSIFSLLPRIENIFLCNRFVMHITCSFILIHRSNMLDCLYIQKACAFLYI